LVRGRRPRNSSPFKPPELPNPPTPLRYVDWRCRDHLSAGKPQRIARRRRGYCEQLRGANGDLVSLSSGEQIRIDACAANDAQVSPWSWVPTT
jgi:hypothetical protein